MEKPQSVAVVRAPRDLQADLRALTNRLEALLDAGSCRIVLDLSDAPYLGSLAFGTIALAAWKAKEGGGRLHVAGVPRRMVGLLDHTGLTQLAPRFLTVDDAVVAFGEGDEDYDTSASR